MTPRNDARSSRDGAGLSVLVADDVPVNLRLIAAMLKRMGHGGVLVPDGAQALRAMEGRHFDVVLLDASMPVLNGLEALREIRVMSERGRPHMPVIIVSGHALPEDREGFLAAGADGFVAKPVSFEILRDEIARVLSVQLRTSA